MLYESEDISARAISLPKVAILLCTHNGERFLAEQLDSIAAQTHSNWVIYASDDGSKDNTIQILESYKSQWQPGRLCIEQGPCRGFADNFISITRKSTIEADYYAYSDQDDIWDDNKLEIAISRLKSDPTGKPALYCSRTRLIDAENRMTGFSPLFSKVPSFRNALVQNIGGGNTMVFNSAARDLIIKANEYNSLPSHDWWAYIVISGCGGKVIYDNLCHINYRQHSANLVGSNNTWRARFNRLRAVWSGQFIKWNNQNIAVLCAMRGHLTAENQEILDLYIKMRKAGHMKRLIMYMRSGVYRQTFLENLMLLTALICNKV